MTAVAHRIPDADRRRGTARGGKDDGSGTASVVKALQLLDLFRGGAASRGVTDLARQAGVPVSTAYRLLAYLVDGGFVVKEGTRYRPAEKLFELGNQVAHSRPQGLRERIAPHLGELYTVTGSTVRLGVLDGHDVVIVDKIVGLRTLPAPTAVGGRVPAACSALGKAMLAFQPADLVADVLHRPLPRLTPRSLAAPQQLRRQLLQVLESRLAFDCEETVLGQVCVATPVMSDGAVVAAISLSSPTHRVDLKRAGTNLLQTARRIELALRA